MFNNIITTRHINLFDLIRLLAFLVYDSLCIPLVGPVKQPSFHNVNDGNIQQHPSHPFIKDRSVCDRSIKHLTLADTTQFSKSDIYARMFFGVTTRTV